MKTTKKAYELYLNELSPGYDSDEWIIGGKRRLNYASKMKYGTALRIYDPIAFEVGFRDWNVDICS